MGLTVGVFTVVSWHTILIWSALCPAAIIFRQFFFWARQNTIVNLSSFRNRGTSCYWEAKGTIACAKPLNRRFPHKLLTCVKKDTRIWWWWARGKHHSGPDHSVLHRTRSIIANHRFVLCCVGGCGCGWWWGICLCLCVGQKHFWRSLTVRTRCFCRCDWGTDERSIASAPSSTGPVLFLPFLALGRFTEHKLAKIPIPIHSTVSLFIDDDKLIISSFPWLLCF